MSVDGRGGLTYAELRKAERCTQCGGPSVAARCDACAARLSLNRFGRPRVAEVGGVGFHVCCQSSGRHRFDCGEAEAKLRDGGPLLPMESTR